MTPMRRHSFVRCMVAVLAVTAVVGAACGDDDGAKAAATPAASAAVQPAATELAKPGATAAVTIADNSFTPATVTVARGGSVTWTWGGRNQHSVAGGEFKSDTKTGSGRFEFKFEKAGTFEYQCGVHGAAMAGKVVVQ